MKQNDRIKLDMITNINETIIDEVTDKKIALSPKLNRTASRTSKRWLAIGSIAACLALLFGVFFVVIVPKMGTKVPVYQGMTIRTESEASVGRNEKNAPAGISFLSAQSPRPAKPVPLSKSNGTPNGVANGHHKEDDDQIESQIEDLVTIDVIADDEVRYYVKPGETFIIEIHIDNPRNYEIQSFTLNGQKYANYMFKEGSTMELLLLEVTAPNEPGYVEYTIDAIKYIDGTEIKDVDMSSGNKSVKAGIAYPKAPSAVVSVQSISTTSAELSVHVIDTYQLIGDHELTVYLSDGEKIIESKPLAVGDNTVLFDNLLISTTYEYGVVTAFDLLDGEDLHVEWLLTNTFATAGAFSVDNAVATHDTISFEVNRIGEIGEITSISLYDAETDEPVETLGADGRAFTNLLSKHAYRIAVAYRYDLNDGTGVQTDTVTHDIMTSPFLEFNSFTVLNTSAVSEGDTIFLRVNITNPDRVEYRDIVVNGKKYNVDQNASTATMLVCEILINGQFEGGDTTLTIEKVIAELDGTSYTIEPQENNTADVFIYGTLKVVGIDAVVYENGQYTERDYFFENDQAYLRIRLNNKTGYTIDSVKIGRENSNGNVYNTLIKLDDEQYLLDCSTIFEELEYGIYSMRLSEIRYSQADFKETIKTEVTSEAVMKMSDRKVHYISKPEDLLKMDSGFKYYELTNDIDLSGIEWKCNDFRGVFNGNGYSIINMTYVGSVTDLTAYVGLFRTAWGVIENVHLENVMFAVKVEASVFDFKIGGIVAAGGKVAGGGDLIINNCSIDENSVMSVSGVSYVTLLSIAGITPFATEISNCVNSATLNVSLEYPSSYVEMGGIAVGSSLGRIEVTNCINNGELTHSNSGEIAGISCEDAIITNCVNIGRINSPNIDTSYPISAWNCTETNCYSLDDTSIEKLSSKEFYTDILGFDETIWNLDDLNIADGKFPVLRQP